MIRDCLKCSGRLEDEIEKRDWRIADLERENAKLRAVLEAFPMWSYIDNYQPEIENKFESFVFRADKLFAWDKKRMGVLHG